MCIFINCFTETHTRLGWIPSALSCSLIGLFVFLYIFGLCVWVGLLFAYLLLVAGLFRLFVAGSNHTLHFWGHCPQWHTKYAPGRKAHISQEAFTGRLEPHTAFFGALPSVAHQVCARAKGAYITRSIHSYCAVAQAFPTSRAFKSYLDVQVMREDRPRSSGSQKHPLSHSANTWQPHP